MHSAFTIFATLAMATVLAEMLLYFVAPQLLARLAILPLGHPRSAKIPAAILDQRQTESLYRSTARAAPSLDQLPFPTTIDGDETVGAWRGEFGWMRATNKWFGWNRSWGIARLRAEIRGDRVYLNAKLYPAPAAVLFLAPVMMFDHAMSNAVAVLVGLGVFLAFLGLNYIMSARRMRDDVDAVLMRIASDIEYPPHR